MISLFIWYCIRRYIDFSFVDLHKVMGLRGVYIASQLTQGRVGHRHITTQITFDKGGLWQPVAAPELDNNGKALNCSLVSPEWSLFLEFMSCNGLILKFSNFNTLRWKCNHVTAIIWFITQCFSCCMTTQITAVKKARNVIDRFHFFQSTLWLIGLD